MTRRDVVKLAASVLAPCGRAAEPSRPQRREFVSRHMGTLWRLVFFDDDEARALAMRDAAWDLIGRNDQTLSDYREDSEVNRLCRAGELGPLSATFEAVLRKSCALAEETCGAFDPTVGPLVRLWRASRKSGVLPDPQAIAEARKRVGWRNIVIRSGAGDGTAGRQGAGAFCTLAQPGMQLDFGGIAKGHTQDAVLRLLRERFGLTRAMVDAGGGVSVGDPPPGEEGWRIQLAAAPDAAPADGEPVVVLANRSLATSGDAHQFVEIAGVRYSHIVDPATGLGLTRPIQASVVAADGAVADALATAFCVLGEPGTREFLKPRPAVVARLLTTPADGRTRIWESKGFDRLTRSQ